VGWCLRLCRESSRCGIGVSLRGLERDTADRFVRAFDTPRGRMPSGFVTIAIEYAHVYRHAFDGMTLDHHALQRLCDVGVIVNTMGVVSLERDDFERCDAWDDPRVRFLAQSELVDEGGNWRGIFEGDGLEVTDFAEYGEEVVLTHFSGVKAESLDSVQGENGFDDLVRRVFYVGKEEAVESGHLDMGEQTHDVFFSDAVELEAFQFWHDNVLFREMEDKGLEWFRTDGKRFKLVPGA